MDAVGGTGSKRPHVVFIPCPGQSHIKAMLKLAKLLYYKGLCITFVNTEFNHKRFLKSGGPGCLDGSPGFQFKTIPDGLPSSDDVPDATQDIAELFHSLRHNCLVPFVDLVAKLETPATCIISDGFMTFAIDAAEKLGIPIMLYWTLAACGFMGFYQLHILMERGIIPLKDESYLTNGYLEMIVDGIPGMEGIRLKDLPTFARTLDPNETVFAYTMEVAQRSDKVSHQILHTFDELEVSVIRALSSMYPHIYTIGPLQLSLNQIPQEEEIKKLDFNGYSLWKEEPECLQWLQSKEPNSVVYVNFGSITVMSLQDLLEFGWGLANSNRYFLWIIRPDLVVGESAVLPPELKKVIKERGFIANWCSQEKVLNEPSVGGFLTHGGWGSTIESLSSGVPMICWPFFADQSTHCRYICKEWEVGMEIGNNVKRDEVTKLIRELMEGEEGKRMRKNAMEWKREAEKATGPNGSSSLNVDKLVNEIITLSETTSSPL